MATPIDGLRVVEFGAIGPVPHAAMILSDLGADVVRIERPNVDLAALATDYLLRGRRSIAVDLKSAADRDSLFALIASADVLIEGNRPGVTERLGIGPQDCLAVNPRLIYARMTGWGQDGPLARRAGHDINYLALTGALYALGDPDRAPVPPLNLVGDFGGGSMLLVIGVLAALVSRNVTGEGQVVDVAMADGVNLLLQMVWSMRASGTWFDDRGSNLADGAAPFYRSYRCSDGRYVAVGAVEPQFYSLLLAGLGIEEINIPSRDDRGNWSALTELIASRFETRARDDWAELFGDVDACVTPVLTFAESLNHPHMLARKAHVSMNGARLAAPAPRFSDTPTRLSDAPPTTLSQIQDVTKDWAENVGN